MVIYYPENINTARGFYMTTPSYLDLRKKFLLVEGCSNGVCSIGSKSTDAGGGSTAAKIGKPSAIFGRNLTKVKVDEEEKVQEEDGGGGGEAGNASGSTETAGTTTHDSALFMGTGRIGSFASLMSNTECPKGTKKKDGVCVVKEDEEQPEEEPKDVNKTPEENKTGKPAVIKTEKEEIEQFCKSLGYDVDISYSVSLKNDSTKFDKDFLDIANRISPGSATPEGVTLTNSEWNAVNQEIERLKRIPPAVPNVPSNIEHKPARIPVSTNDARNVPFPKDFSPFGL